MIRSPYHAIIGYGWDGLLSYWNLWWTWQALTTPTNPFVATTMYHPFGLPLYFHTYNFLTSIISLPVQACCGLATAYNAMIILTLLLAALGAYTLAFVLTHHHGAAFIAGIIYAFNPYITLHISVAQPHLISVQWLPFYLLALLLCLRAPPTPFPWRLLLLAALLLVFNGLSDWHYTIYALLLTAIVGSIELLRQPTHAHMTHIAARIACIGICFVLAMSPILVPMLLEIARSPYAARSLNHSIYHSTDLLAFLLPSIYHPWWGAWASDIFHDRLVRWYIVGGVATLGYVPMILALGAILSKHSSRLLFMTIFVTFFLLSLGPYLQINGVNSYDAGHPIPMPYLLLYQLPLMNFQRVPSRFVVGVMLALAMLAALGTVWLWQQLPRTMLAPVLLFSLIILILFEFWPRPFPMTPVGPEQVSPLYVQLGATPGHSAILEVPHLDNYSLFYQTYHQQPTVGGKISRHKGHPWRQARVFGPLIRVQPSWDDVGRDESPSAARSALACQGVETVVFYQTGVDEKYQPLVHRIEQDLFSSIDPTYEDTNLRAYTVTNAYPHVPYWTLAPNEWHPPDTNEQGIRYRWATSQHGGLLLYPCIDDEATPTATRAFVRFNLFSLDQPRTLDVTWNGTPLTRTTLPQATVRRYMLMLPLQSGEHRLNLMSHEPPMTPIDHGFQNDDRTISFNISQISVLVADE